MNKYIFYVINHFNERFLVEAESREEAEEIFDDGGSELIRSDLTYQEVTNIIEE